MDDNSRYTTANLQVYLLRCLAGMSKDFGISPDRLCQGLGFEVADLSNPECRVSFRQASSMIRRAIETAPGRALGLDIGINETIGSIGLVGYAMLTSPTLGEAVSLGISMQNHAGSMLLLDLHQTPSTASVSATSRYHEPDILLFLVEEAFGNFLKIVHALVGDDFRPSKIDLSFPKPAYSEQYDRIFRCPIRYEQKDNLFSCDATWLARPIATYDPLSHRQVLEILQITKSQEINGPDLLESIERIVRRDLQQAPTLAEVANQLCMSDRTLRRRLADSGISYQVILDNIRKKRALTLLTNARLSIEEIAYEVGFSDSHNFRRAFRRWTGHGPSEVR
ncbi:AraC-type DNA-binding protein [Paraburkholderia steynii]|uniref:AraC-type DNA-binding protein n=1 Tax=Paraburkholderia steynii TaxID=1245441 RepID=A0A7Z7BAW3_9BURK|nr:AraC family transcriptional regulator [Paraburkholderia steynii]SDI49414.1 AraC-type DNA-binding protein [Paraburkholderia steynii]